MKTIPQNTNCEEFLQQEENKQTKNPEFEQASRFTYKSARNTGDGGVRQMAPQA